MMTPECNPQVGLNQWSCGLRHLTILLYETTIVNCVVSAILLRHGLWHLTILVFITYYHYLWCIWNIDTTDNDSPARTASTENASVSFAISNDLRKDFNTLIFHCRRSGQATENSSKLGPRTKHLVLIWAILPYNIWYLEVSHFTYKILIPRATKCWLVKLFFFQFISGFLWFAHEGPLGHEFGPSEYKYLKKVRVTGFKGSTQHPSWSTSTGRKDFRPLAWICVIV